MPNPIDRRQLMATAAAASLLALAPAAALAEPVMGEIVLGNADAPVTVIEYASFTCPHCASFAVNTFPQFKEAYIDTGKAKFILREVYFDRFGLWAAMAARCGGEAAYYPMAEHLFKRQKEWTRVEEERIPDEIRKIARLNGISDDQFKACLTDQDFAKNLVDTYKQQSTADDVKSTPTFFINGDRHGGNMPFEEFAKLIDAHL